MGCSRLSPNNTPIGGDSCGSRALARILSTERMATTTNLEPDRGWEVLPAFGSSGADDRPKNFARARRHTRAVRFLRGVLPFCARLEQCLDTKSSQSRSLVTKTVK